MKLNSIDQVNKRISQIRKKTYRLIDLFAGAGGLTLGFSKRLGHPFIPVWANDYNKESVESYNYNLGPHCVHGDIVSILEERKIKIPRADVVIGGPPRQGFSLLNKNREVDPRKELWRPFLEVVKLSGADIFVMALILVVCVPMGACGADTRGQPIVRTSLTGSSEATSNTNETLTLTEKDHDTVVKLRTGSRLIIRLHAIPGTGYGWQMIKNTTPQLKLIEQPAYEQGEHGVLGGPATEVFRFLTA